MCSQRVPGWELVTVVIPNVMIGQAESEVIYNYKDGLVLIFDVFPFSGEEVLWLV